MLRVDCALSMTGRVKRYVKKILMQQLVSISKSKTKRNQRQSRKQTNPRIYRNLRGDVMFKKLSELVETRLKIAVCEFESLREALNAKGARREWDEETGQMFNNLVLQYPISEDELFQISEYVCKFMGYSRLPPEKFRQYFFLDEECSNPRVPWMLYDTEWSKKFT